MKKLFVMMLLLMAISNCLPAETLIWNYPDTEKGAVRIPSNDYTPSSGIFRLDTNIFDAVTNNWVNGPSANSGLRFGSWNIPAATVSTWVDENKKTHTTHSGFCRIQARKGDYNFRVYGEGTKDKPLSGNWTVGSQLAPLFGLETFSQVGNKNPYADGSKTIEQRGCYMASILSLGKYFNYWQNLTMEEFNQMLKDKKGFSGRDIISSVAARLLGMVYIGEFPYSIENIQKYMAKGYGMSVKVSVPHNGYSTQHFVAHGPGVLLKGNEVCRGMMDPANRCQWFHTCNYTPLRLKVFAPYIPPENYAIAAAAPALLSMDEQSDTYIPFYKTVPGWWNDPKLRKIEQSKNYSYQSVYAAPNSAEEEIVSEDTIYRSGLCQIEAETSSGVFIEKVEIPGFILTKESSGHLDSYFLIDTFSNEKHDDMTVCFDCPSTNILDDKSGANITLAPPGKYRFYLTGEANYPWKLLLFVGDHFGEWQTKELSGTLNIEGKANVEFDFDPGTTILKLSAINNLAVDSVVEFRKEVTASFQDEFYCEEKDRSRGVRIISSAKPEVGRLAKVIGKVVMTDKGLAVEANSVDTNFYYNSYPIQPLGMPGDWPEFANNLLAKVWGKVIIVGESQMVIDNGSGPKTICNLNEEVMIGDYVSLNGILQPDKTVRMIPGSLVKE